MLQAPLLFLDHFIRHNSIVDLFTYLRAYIIDNKFIFNQIKSINQSININAPLSGLYWKTKKCRSEDKEGVLLASAFEFAYQRVGRLSVSLAIHNGNYNPVMSRPKITMNWLSSYCDLFVINFQAFKL